MFKIATYCCARPNCGEFEDLVDGDPPESTECPNCHSAEKVSLVPFGPPSSTHNPVMNKIFTQGSMMRKRYLGLLPWRKSSESQSD